SRPFRAATASCSTRAEWSPAKPRLQSRIISACPWQFSSKEEPKLKVELGAHTGQQDIELDELRRLWRRLDEAGMDWISVWDHFYESPPRDGNGVAYEGVSLMSALALETQRCRVGCLVFCVGYRNPALLAKSMITI